MGAESDVDSSSSITAFPTDGVVAIVGVLNNYSVQNQPWDQNEGCAKALMFVLCW